MFSRLLFTLTLASIGVLGYALWHVLDQPVRGFVIVGELTKLERAELQKTLAAQPVEGILSTSLAAISAHVDSLPWARRVSIRRQWPDQLVVSMHVASPVARWGERQYLTAYGDLLVLPDSYPGLPEFAVALATPEEAMQVYRLLEQIVAREQMTVSRLQQNQQGQWIVELARGPKVLLGAEQLNERMHRFLLVHRRVLSADERAVDYVDARYGNGVAVKFSEETTDGEEALMVAQNQKTSFGKGND